MMNNRVNEMNKRIAELYDQAIVLEGNGDYVSGELDPVKFAELIIRECAGLVQGVPIDTMGYLSADQKIKQHFGVAE